MTAGPRIAPSKPSLLLLNARVRTLDAASPAATAVAIAGDSILAVGEGTQVRALAGPGTRIVDCGGAVLIPGLHDAHIHLFAHVSRLSAVDCSPPAVRSISELQQALRQRAAALPADSWLRAAGYDDLSLAEKRHPTRWDLDAAAPDHPLRLHHRSYHASVLNSLALRLAGITAETPEPPGGLIERDPATGEPNGVLYETAQELVQRVIPPLTSEDLAQGVAEASRQYLSWGITALQDATASNTLADWGTFRRLQQDGYLHQRVTMMIGRDGLAEALKAGMPPSPAAGPLRLGPVKIVLGETTGSLHPHPEELNRQVLAVHRAGLQVALHVVTPEALEAAIAAIECAQTAYPRSAPRHRVEHCSVCGPASALRMANLGIHVCTQPSFIHYGGHRYLTHLPAEQLAWLYPLRTLREAGVRLAASSDCPVVPANPWAGLYGAATRKTAAKEVVASHQSIPAAAALEMYTHGAATASFQDRSLGKIAPGYLADLALLTEDPLAGAADRLLDIRSLLTIVSGGIAWEA